MSQRDDSGERPAKSQRTEGSVEAAGASQPPQLAKSPSAAHAEPKIATPTTATKGKQPKPKKNLYTAMMNLSHGAKTPKVPRAGPAQVDAPYVIRMKPAVVKHLLVVLRDFNDGMWGDEKYPRVNTWVGDLILSDVLRQLKKLKEKVTTGVDEKDAPKLLLEFLST